MKSLRLHMLVFCIAASFLCSTPSGAGPVVAGAASVIDGDSLVVSGEQVRLYGIDAPESDQVCEKDREVYPCGQVASNALAEKVGRRPVRCEVRDIDRYGRLVAVCFAGNEDLSRWMAREGHAVAYRYFSDAYIADENAAKKARLGVWAGRFVMPWQWRRGKRLSVPGG